MDVMLRLRPIAQQVFQRLRLGRLMGQIEAARYFDSRVWDHLWGNRHIGDTIRSGRPHAIGKLGAVELGAIRAYLRLRDHPRRDELSRPYRQLLFANAGVYPNDWAIFSRFAESMIEKYLAELTCVLVWFNRGEAKMVKRHCRGAVRVRLGSLAACLWDEPWTMSLSGKKVLVVSPFTKSILRQYPNRSGIWGPTAGVLPTFAIDGLKVPFSPALVPPAGADWFQTLEQLKADMASRDFDVALIGAGAYSVPLAVHAKTMGRVGIHTGGETQFLFGVKGGRWDSQPMFNRFYNEHWRRPLPEETPDRKDLIEDGCYW